MTDASKPDAADDLTPVQPHCHVPEPAPPFDAQRPILPTPQQLKYQEDQLGAFVHFGPAAWTGDSDFFVNLPPDSFDPNPLDCAQWMAVARSVGARHIVLTAKHHNGFCLWPTKTTDYSVASSPWRAGRGDVVREFVDAARRADLRPGLYYSCGDTHFDCPHYEGTGRPQRTTGDRDAYFRVAREQLCELLNDYGDLAVIWFDGAFNPFVRGATDANGREADTRCGDDLVALVRDRQPGALIFGITKPDVRWSGSEGGWAPYPLWNVVAPGRGRKHWVDPDFHGWISPESNIHPRANWFWMPNSDDTYADVPRLMQAYHESIGRGANLLVNLTPDTTGLVPDFEAQRLAEFGRAIEQRYGTSVAETSGLELTLPHATRVDCVVIEEDLRHGQRVYAYELAAMSGADWRTIATGQSIGRKRIELFDPVATERLRLRITDAPADPRVRRFAAFEADTHRSP